MAKHKYVLLGNEVGAGGNPVMKELATYEGGYLKLAGQFVEVHADDLKTFPVAVIRLAEGQSVKQVE